MIKEMPAKMMEAFFDFKYLTVGKCVQYCTKLN